MIKLKKKKFKNLILKVDAYRKYIRSVNFINNYKKKICLVCYSISFGGYSLNLLKDYFSYKNYEIYNYKDNFEFLNLNSKIQNYLYNYKFHNFYKKNNLLINLNYIPQKKQNNKLNKFFFYNY